MSEDELPLKQLAAKYRTGRDHSSSDEDVPQMELAGRRKQREEDAQNRSFSPSEGEHMSDTASHHSNMSVDMLSIHSHRGRNSKSKRAKHRSKIDINGLVNSLVKLAKYSNR